MTVVDIIDTITGWVEKTICPQIKLKVPPDSEIDATDQGYEYQLANPTAFSMYVPTKEKLPPNVVSPFPSICIRFMEGADDIGSFRGNIGIQFCFSAWDPGLHRKDVLIPDKDNCLEYHQWSGKEAEAYFRRTGDGWRDVWNMVDICLRELENVTNINGIVIDRSTAVKFGPLAEQEAIPDYYPFWFAWVSFSVQYPVVRNLGDVEDLW